MNLAGRPSFRPRKRCFVFAAALCAAALISQTSHAEKRRGAMVPNKPALGQADDGLNANTIAVFSDSLNATYVIIACDPSAVFDGGDEFRLLPGWKRFEGAEEWLRAHAAVLDADRGRFDNFLAMRQLQAEPASFSNDERDQLSGSS